jgi:hypothetical protein
MAIQELLNEIVIHKSFGIGIIKSIDDKYLQVEFIDKNKTSKFAYPACFNGFLTLKNGEKQAAVQEDLALWKSENHIGEKETLRHLYEKRMQKINERQELAAQKKLRAAQKSLLIVF